MRKQGLNFQNYKSITLNLHYINASEKFNSGNEHDARQIVVQNRNAPNQSAEEHAAWAELCENLGMAKAAMESWQQAVAGNNSNSEYLYRLGVLHYERGAVEKACKFLQRAVDQNSDHKKARGLLAEIYAAVGDAGASCCIDPDAAGESNNIYAGQKSFDPQIHIDDITKFLRCFSGRECGYALQQLDNAGRSYFTDIESRLTAEQIYDHIRGRITLAGYPLRGDDTLKFAVIDIGINQRRLRDNIKNEGMRYVMQQKAGDYARQLRAMFKNMSLPVLISDNTAYGRSVWLLFGAFIPRQLAERFCRKLLDKMPNASSDLDISIKTGMTVEADGWHNNPLILPFGYNRRTGLRLFFRNIQDDLIENQMSVLRETGFISLDTVRSLLSCFQDGFTILSKVPDEMPDTLKSVFRKCPVINELVCKARTGRPLKENEKLVVYHSLGLLPDQRASLHYAIELCGDYSRAKTERLVRQIRPNPVSCPKIRELLPDITSNVNCDCKMSLKSGEYPSPLYHSHRQPQADKHNFHNEDYLLEDAVRRYSLLKRELCETERAVSRMERRIRKIIMQKNTDLIKTEYGIVKIRGDRLEIIN